MENDNLVVPLFRLGYEITTALCIHNSVTEWQYMVYTCRSGVQHPGKGTPIIASLM